MLKKTDKNGPTFGYAKYQFRKDEQDPIVDRLRTIWEDYGQNINKTAGEAGISPGTLSNWFNGKTKRPQYATSCAVLRTMGYDFAIVPLSKGQTDAHTTAQIIKRFPTRGQE